MGEEIMTRPGFEPGAAFSVPGGGIFRWVPTLERRIRERVLEFATVSDPSRPYQENLHLYTVVSVYFGWLRFAAMNYRLQGTSST